MAMIIIIINYTTRLRSSHLSIRSFLTSFITHMSSCSTRQHITFLDSPFLHVPGGGCRCRTNYERIYAGHAAAMVVHATTCFAQITHAFMH